MERISILSLLDLSAAFNNIDHILYCPESSYSICDMAPAWFRSYRIDRSQTISVNSRYSPSTPLKRGVPQDSVLGQYCLSSTPSLCQLSWITTLCCMKVMQMIHSYTDIESDFQQMIATTEDCLSDITSCVTQANSSSKKTEVLLAIPSKFKNYPSLPDSFFTFVLQPRSHP